MRKNSTINAQRLLIILLLVAYVFSPTLFNWMISPSGSWYRPFIIWFAVIVIAFVFQQRRLPNDV